MNLFVHKLRYPADSISSYWTFSIIVYYGFFFLQTDWNDGFAASHLAKAKGAPVPGFREMSNHPDLWVSNLDVALNGSKKIGVQPVLEAR